MLTVASRACFAVSEFVSSWRVSSLSREVKSDRLTYLSWQKLASLESCCSEIADRPGDVVECGVALGGSAIIMASLLPDRDFHGYDLFGMIPAPSAQDGTDSHDRYKVILSGHSTGIGPDPYYGYQPDLRKQVEASFSRYGVPVDGMRVHLHEGMFQDTLRIRAPIALAHIDCDWYEAVQLCLARLYPCLIPGGLIVIDDYFDYQGCKDAVDSFLSLHPELHVRRDGGHRVLQRNPA